ncbi:hypothetical protein [Sorangium sp. So ce887]|uniref:hypothetical protein n=1 Tax=unclassified Sorangium TaxID=2621164 RepID=UPI003F5DCF77
MRVRLILENGGNVITKRVELPEAPAVATIVMAERERRVVSGRSTPSARRRTSTSARTRTTRRCR